jgi:hypothetical protein
MFPILAEVGAVNLTLRSHHNNRIRDEKSAIDEDKRRRLQIEDEERADKREERKIKVAAKYGLAVNPIVSQNVNSAVNMPSITEIDSQNDGSLMTKLIAGKRSKIDARRDMLVDIVRAEPNIEKAELARRLGLGSVNTLNTDIEHLVAFGRIKFENRVFEVLS